MKRFILFFSALIFGGICHAQLQITNEPSALALAQRLVGEGVTISNVTFTGNSLMAAKFKNIGGLTNINIDSGIVLTTGRAKTGTGSDQDGVDGDGTTAASSVNASGEWNLPGDDDLAAAIGADPDDLNDACVLEFDFIPSGDSVKFRYVFSSEEYYEGFVCDYNDAFAFFISGPGITGMKNIALVPGTNIPVSIINVNNVTVSPANCPNNTSYYVDNTSNRYFTHEGHTRVLTAYSAVQPCNVYHLKLVVSDNMDARYDTGVFLEAKSLSSNIVSLTNNTQTDDLNNSYIVEGCVTGSFTISRPRKADYPLSIQLTYGGTAINGVDVQPLPTTVTIPAYDSIVTVSVVPIIDNVPEGIEYIKVYAGAGCSSVAPIDSTVIQIRDYDTLTILPQSQFICKDASLQLTASAAYSTFQWDAAAPGLSNYAVNNPLATPTQSSTTYICTASVGTCHGRDSVRLQWKELEFGSSTNVNCQGASSGQIVVSGGAEWSSPQYDINNLPPQTGGTFNNLPVGNYMVHITDPSGCKDSLPVNIIQAYPDLLITDTAMVAATCTSASDGSITITASGGKLPYKYSLNNGPLQTDNVFHVGSATYSIAVVDANNCRKDMTGIYVPFINGITLSTGANPAICESKSVVLPASTNANSVVWRGELPSQTATLNNPSLLNPTANPVVTTKYYIRATLGVCILEDSITVLVNPAPVADAGDNVTVCYGGQTQLHGSGGVDYEWHPATYLSNENVNNPLVSQASTIQYSLDVIDANGCKSLSRDVVTVTVLPPARLFAGLDTVVAIKQPLQLSALDINHVGFTQYTWSPADGLNNPFIRNPLAMLTAANTDLIVTASTPDNCVGIDTINVKTYKGPEIYVANVFTPNGDGTNDVLKAFPVGIKSFKYFSVYNRYGQLVFSTTDENVGWNGMYKGLMQQLSTFVWIAAGVDFKGNVIERKGTTTILR